MQGFCAMKLPACYRNKRNILYISIHLARLMKTEKRCIRYLRRGTVPSAHNKVACDLGVTPRYLIITNIVKENVKSSFYLEDRTNFFFVVGICVPKYIVQHGKVP